VEVLSVWRTREHSFFPFPPGVKITAADDRRAGRGGLAARALRHVPGTLLYPGDRTSRKTTLWTDVQLLRRLWRIRSGVLIGTRPALNLLVAQAGGGPARVATEHAPYPRYNRWLKREIRRRYPSLDAAVVLTEGDRRALEAAVAGSVEVCVIPNAVPRLPGGPSALDRPVVLAAGRLLPVKGFDRLIRAFALAAPDQPEWVLRICGSGEEQGALRALAAELGLGGRMQLPGRVREIGGELNGAAVFALSSRTEGLPLALLEAMSKGLAVVSFDCPTGPRELIEHGVNGLLVPNGDEVAFGRALATLMEDEQLRRRLGAAALRTAERYSLNAAAEHWAALVARLTAG